MLHAHRSVGFFIKGIGDKTQSETRYKLLYEDDTSLMQTRLIDATHIEPEVDLFKLDVKGNAKSLQPCLLKEEANEAYIASPLIELKLRPPCTTLPNQTVV